MKHILIHTGSILFLTCFTSFYLGAQVVGPKIDNLNADTVNLKDVIIKADRLNQKSAVSEIVLSKETLKSNHGLLEDPIRIVSTMPGVSRSGDLFSPSQIYVRGGAPEENLFLNNNAKIYFPFYFGGQKSIFNSDVIENVELLTGGFSAKYGNALSSVLNATTRDGKQDGFAGLFSVGFYNSALLIEGPMSKKANFLVAARRTYLDLLLDETSEFPVPEFGDVTYKASWFPTKGHKISLSGVSGYEKLDFLAANPLPGMPDKLKTRGNSHSQSLQWQYVNDKGYSKLSFTNTIQATEAIVSRNINLKINGIETGLREDLEYRIRRGIKLQTGFEIYRDHIDFNSTLPKDPREVDPTDTNVVLNRIVIDDQYTVGGGWLSLVAILTKTIGINAGVRYDGNNLAKYSTLAPRLSAYYTLGPKTELRVAFSYNNQFAPSEVLSRQNDILAPLCVHYIAGIRQHVLPGFSGWVEVYSKQYSRLVTYDANFKYANDGKGYAKGIEFFFTKDKGRITGWISYALSVAKRRSNLDTKEYFFDYDQRHIVNLSTQYKIKHIRKQWYMPAIINLQVRGESGRPYTPVFGAVKTPNGWMQQKGEINSNRENHYLNVNFRIEWHIFAAKRLKMVSFIEVWNLLNRKNPLGRTFQYGTQYANNINVQEYYTTPILPAGGIRLEFQ